MAVPISGTDLLAPFPERWDVQGGIMLNTHCLFPSGDHVSIFVRRDDVRGVSVVSDRGAGWEAAFAAGLDPESRACVRSASKAAEQAGARFENGEFFIASVPDAELSGWITHLANLVQGWVTVLVSRARSADEVSLDSRLLQILDQQFGAAAVTRGAEVLGDSTRPYEMTAVVRLRDDKQGLFRTVQQHASSLFACTTAFGDIARADRSSLRVAVIAGLAAWQAADITLLGQSATHIIDVERGPDSALRRLAA